MEKFEIYPYKSKGVYLKVLKKRVLQTNVIEYSHSKYIELFSNDANIEKIITEALIKILELSGSTNGFLSIIVTNTSESICIRYYCIVMNVGGISFQSQVSTQDCTITTTGDSLLTRGIKTGNTIISNDVKTDPRSLYNQGSRQLSIVPKNHIQLDTFVGVPLVYNGEIFGQIGLANGKKYDPKQIAELYPLILFFTNFVYLYKTDSLSVIKGKELYNQINILKDSFIATMSHELRTPLNGIVGMTRLLSDSEGLTAKQCDYLRILSECSTQLMELLNDILDYHKMISGGIVLNEQPFSLRACLSQAMEIVSQRASEKGIALNVYIPEKMSDNFCGDSRRLKQILFNLLTNAIKFTNKGSIDISVECRDVDQETNSYLKNKRLQFKIKDTGVGIKLENQQKIFQVFTKLTKDDKFYTDSTPGVGLGLAICKYIVTQMKGNISVESDGKTGSTFTFHVILQDEGNINDIVQTYHEELIGKKVLIIDDKEENRIFLTECFYSWNIECVAFSSGREALRYIEKFPFDIAIIDLQMPGMNGIEVVQTMRERGYKKPIIGISSIGTNVNGHEWFDQFVEKPITKSKLFNLLIGCLIEKKVPLEKDKCGKLKILIAEDDHYNQIVITELLESLGYTDTKIVSNGQTCIEEAKKSIYDVCLMDVKMPIMDGLEATRIIKKYPNPPTIIGISASVLDADKNKCFIAGMDGYIPKPIQKDQLASTLANLNGRRKSISLGGAP